MRTPILLLGLVSLALAQIGSVQWCPHNYDPLISTGGNGNYRETMEWVPAFSSNYASHEQLLLNPPGRISVKDKSEALSFAKDKFPDANLKLNGDHYIGINGVGHYYFSPGKHHGVPILNAHVNVNVDANGHVYSYGATITKKFFLAIPNIEKRDVLDPLDGLKIAVGALSLPIDVKHAKIHAREPMARVQTKKRAIPSVYRVSGVEDTVRPPEVEFIYWAMPDGKALPAWEVFVEAKQGSYKVYVDVDNGHVVDTVHLTHHAATFQVYPLSTTNPTKGPRVIATDPWDTEVSSSGWLSVGGKRYKETKGNNADVFNKYHDFDVLNPDEFRPKRKSTSFEYPYDPNSLSPNDYREAAMTQVFYTINKAHDIYYRLGFNEEAGSFQQTNSKNKKRAKGRVRVFVHESKYDRIAGYTHAKGGDILPEIRLGWNTRVSPPRDPAFDMDVVLHEYTHGLTHRLIGGPNTMGCVDAWEARGMNEGLSDFMAIAIGLNSTSHAQRYYRTFGNWTLPNAPFRNYPYSTRCVVNPVNFGDLDALETQGGLGTFYDIGTFFANILLDFMWTLIDWYGIEDDEYPQFRKGTTIPTDGRYLAMRLVMDSMALLPCNPTIIGARDALLDADSILTNGHHHCLIWLAFSKRHVGVGAESGRAQFSSEAYPKTTHQGYKPRKSSVEYPKHVCRR